MQIKTEEKFMMMHDKTNKRLSQRQQTGFINIYLCPGNITRTITDEQ